MSLVKHIRKNDTVVALSGAISGKYGKVIAINNTKSLVKVEGLGMVKKHQKPNQKNTKGGVVEFERWYPASKFMVCDSSGKAKGRVSWTVSEGKKTRKFSSSKGK